MQTIVRKTESKAKGKEKLTKDDTGPSTKKSQDDKKRTAPVPTTPRNFVQKSSTADIYVQKKKVDVHATRTPKKIVGTTSKNSNVSPMKDLLKSSTSTTSVGSKSSLTVKDSISNKIARKNSSFTNAKDSKAPNIASSSSKTSFKNAKDSKAPNTVASKNLPSTNVTVNSPVAKKRLVKDGGKKTDSKEARIDSDTKQAKKKSSHDTKEVERLRSKTRTLAEDEVKVLSVDNNVEMQNLSRKLKAQPKAFYVDLDQRRIEPRVATDTEETADTKASEDENTYEDDFESYESDFESYQGSQSENSGAGDDDDEDEHDGESADDYHEHSSDTDEEELRAKERGVEDRQVEKPGKENVEDGNREVKDDEKMLDSGNFELRDTRSASKPKPTMDFILENGEVDVKSSLTDEGFLEMSSSSVSSMKNVHTEVLDRRLFIDFTKSKESKRKKKVFDRLKQRAKDILSMVTLHEMSYSLFEMKPIPYDVYMTTFGRANYTQTASQTFDDGLSEEVQTEEILCEEKWTQHPVEFSKSTVHLKPLNQNRKYSSQTLDYLTKFTFLVNITSDVELNNQMNCDENYKMNPLRMYFEQKDGVGPCQMLPLEKYEEKLSNKSFNNKRLGKFLKRVEQRVCNILTINRSDEFRDLSKSTKCPFSKGFKAISTDSIANEKLQFLKQTKVTGVILSDTRSNLVFTIHNNCPDGLANKTVLCLWDVSVAIREPIKLLIAINNVSIARHKGDSCGIFAAGLDDGSIHIWDLSEEPTWHPDDVASEKKDELVEVTATMTRTESDREWNTKNVHVGTGELPLGGCLLHASAYTTSASAMQVGGSSSPVTGLVLDTRRAREDGSRKNLGQVYALQRIGIIYVWHIIQEKVHTSADIGKAYWSKVKLEKNQSISLIDHLALCKSDSLENTSQSNFNLNAAKRRISLRKKEKSLKRQLSRQKSTVKSDSDKPASAAASKTNAVLPGWESGVACTDLKVMRLNDNDNYLVAKNCGEVVCCSRNVGVVKFQRFCVANDLSTVTCLEVSRDAPQHFLAATDNGTLSLCSLAQSRVLLTLDCRNAPPEEIEKYQPDSKGRFLGSAVVMRSEGSDIVMLPSIRLSVRSVVWTSNPCRLIALLTSGALVAWDLTQSDIYPRVVAERIASVVSANGDSLALLTPGGEVQVHTLGDTSCQHLQLFHKYAALL